MKPPRCVNEGASLCLPTTVSAVARSGKQAIMLRRAAPAMVAVPTPRFQRESVGRCCASSSVGSSSSSRSCSASPSSSSCSFSSRPGDVTSTLLGPMGSENAKKVLRAEMGLDRPLPVQYAKWVAAVVQGDFRHVMGSQAPGIRDHLSEVRETPRCLPAQPRFSLTCSASRPGCFAAAKSGNPLRSVHHGARAHRR